LAAVYRPSADFVQSDPFAVADFAIVVVAEAGFATVVAAAGFASVVGFATVVAEADFGTVVVAAAGFATVVVTATGFATVVVAAAGFATVVAAAGFGAVAGFATAVGFATDFGVFGLGPSLVDFAAQAVRGGFLGGCPVADDADSAVHPAAAVPSCTKPICCNFLTSECFWSVTTNPNYFQRKRY